MGDLKNVLGVVTYPFHKLISNLNKNPFCYGLYSL